MLTEMLLVVARRHGEQHARLARTEDDTLHAWNTTVFALAGGDTAAQGIISATWDVVRDAYRKQVAKSAAEARS